MISITRLQHIINHCKSHRCGDTQDFIAGALSNNWSDDQLTNPCLDDYYNEHWIQNRFYGEYINQQLINTMCLRLDEHGYITVDVDWRGLEHSFVVCNTDVGQMKVDSYVKLRRVSYESVDLRRVLTSLVYNMSVETWNSMFGVNEVIKPDNQGELWIVYSYNDETQEQAIYTNDVFIC